MTKEEILATICNHEREVFDAVHNCEATIRSLVLNQVPVADQRPMALKSRNMLQYAKNKLDVIMDAIGQWPA